MKKIKIFEIMIALSIIIGAAITTISLPMNGAQAASVTPLFGNTAIGSIMDQNDPNAQSVSLFTSTTTGTVTDIFAYIDGVSAGNCIAALYAANGNSAGALLAQSSAVIIGTTFSWVDFKLLTSYTVTSGITYGLAIMGNVPVNVLEVSGTGQRDHNAVSSYSGGFANPFGAIWGTSSEGAMSIYAANTSNKITNTGTGSLVYLNLPQPSNATSPPAAPGTPSHPTNIQLRCYHFTQDSTFGAFDAILVYLWIPQTNSYSPAALITDTANVELYQNLWNKTFVWLKQTNPAANMLNVIQVNANDLDIHTETPSPASQFGDMLVVNLTKPATINLPFNLLPLPYAACGNMTFTLPPMVLKFRPIAESYYDLGANALLPSGYYRQPISQLRTPAWVEESIPSWLGAVSPLEVSGHIDYKFSEVITPPGP